MPAKVLVIGLDAADAPTLEAAMDRGQLPVLAAFRKAGAQATLENCVETLQGAVWSELNSGRAAHRHGRFYHERQLHTGEARLRQLTPEEMGPKESYWYLASEAGRRVAAIDITHAAMAPHLNGIQLVEWGLHDRTSEIGSSPPSLLPELRRTHGDHPVGNCDHYLRTHNGYRQLRKHLIEGVRRKTRVIVDLMSREIWDLFTFNFSECHCAGHHFWHFHDAKNAWHPRKTPADLKRALLDIYRELDRSIGTIIAAAGDDAHVLVVTSHGLEGYTGGYQLVPEVLARLGMNSDRGRKTDSVLRKANNALKYVVPRTALPAVYRLAATRIVRDLQDRAGCLVNPLESPRTKAATVPNNQTGAIRLNLKGREPFGCVAPGNESKSLLSEISQEFAALVLPDSKTPIVEWVRTPCELFGPDHHPNLPDLLVRFRRDLGVLEECESPRIGYLRVPLNRAYNPRTGDHTPVSRLWIRTPKIPSGTTLDDANALDIAPTVLKLLDVEIPDWIDGQVLPTLA